MHIVYFKSNIELSKYPHESMAIGLSLWKNYKYSISSNFFIAGIFDYWENLILPCYVYIGNKYPILGHKIQSKYYLELTYYSESKNEFSITIISAKTIFQKLFSNDFNEIEEIIKSINSYLNNNVNIFEINWKIIKEMKVKRLPRQI